MVHEQKFKDLLSSTCQVSPERIVLDLESEVMRGLCSIPTGGNIFHWISFFHIVKPLMPILALLPTLFNYEKTRLRGFTCPGGRVLKDFSAFRNYICLTSLTRAKCGTAQPCVGKIRISLVLLNFLHCNFRLWFETP